MGVEPKIGGCVLPPKWMVDFMEKPMNKWMIWGVFPTPIFGSTPMLGNGWFVTPWLKAQQMDRRVGCAAEEQMPLLNIDGLQV